MTAAIKSKAMWCVQGGLSKPAVACNDRPTLVPSPEHHNGWDYLWEMPYKIELKSDFDRNRVLRN